MTNVARQRAKTEKSKKGEKLTRKIPEDGEYCMIDPDGAKPDVWWYPSVNLAALLLIAARLVAAAFSSISDCDETYNYWEPLYHLLYGGGLQTWEYSPAYALRSYAALWVAGGPAAAVGAIFDLAPREVFYLTRITLALFSAVCELFYYRAICREYGMHIARLWLYLWVPATGAMLTGAAMLPSAWCSALSAAAHAAWLHDRLGPAVFMTAVSALLGWPFAGLLGLPIAIDFLLLQRRWFEFCRWCVVSLIIIVPTMIAVDSWYYGRFVFAPWNIISYNIFSKHGPSLYGVESWHYYLNNMGLTLNVIWVLCVFCPLLLWLCHSWLESRPLAASTKPYFLPLLAPYMWLVVFLLQPHKEERFMYPIYPMVCLCGAIGTDCLQRINTRMEGWGEILEPSPAPRRDRRAPHYLEISRYISVIVIALSVCLSTSRSVALHRYYSAPMRILDGLGATPGPGVLCLGKEWHRYPSSFLLPDTSYSVRFIRSEFRGLLPAPFSPKPNGTRIIHKHFNEKNKEDRSQYAREDECDYMLDSSLGHPTELEPQYYTRPNWQMIANLPILDGMKMKQPYRSLYIPLLSSFHARYENLLLLKRAPSRKVKHSFQT